MAPACVAGSEGGGEEQGKQGREREEEEEERGEREGGRGSRVPQLLFAPFPFFLFNSSTKLQYIVLITEYTGL